MFTEDGYNWKRTPKGYYYTTMVRNGRERTVYYHRWLVEKVLGRPLLRYEDVHHVDTDKENNDLGNLEIRDHLDHSKLHLSRIPPGSNRGIKHKRHRKKGEPKRGSGRPRSEKPPPRPIGRPRKERLVELPALPPPILLVPEPVIALPVAAEPEPVAPDWEGIIDRMRSINRALRR
jgi:hypothetical protein